MPKHDTTRTCGIYRITNTKTGECYIGSSQNIAHRVGRQHRGGLRRGDHPNPLLQQAWDTYGPDAFDFSIAEETPGLDSVDLFAVEQGYIDREQPAYNQAITAGGGPAGGFHTEETRARISAAVRAKPKTEEHKRKLADHMRSVRCTTFTPEQIAKRAVAQTGAKRSDECRAKISAANCLRVLSPETRAKIGAGNKGKSHPHTAETRARISATKTGVPKAQPMSDDQKAKLSAAGQAYQRRQKLARGQLQWDF